MSELMNFIKDFLLDHGITLASVGSFIAIAVGFLAKVSSIVKAFRTSEAKLESVYHEKLVSIAQELEKKSIGLEEAIELIKNLNKKINETNMSLLSIPDYRERLKAINNTIETQLSSFSTQLSETNHSVKSVKYILERKGVKDDRNNEEIQKKL